jgi:hypothetical protein
MSEFIEQFRRIAGMNNAQSATIFIAIEMDGDAHTWH